MATERITVKRVKQELDILKEAFGHFVENDFKHLSQDVRGLMKRLDKLYTIMLTALISTCLVLLGLVANLILTISKG